MHRLLGHGKKDWGQSPRKLIVVIDEWNTVLHTTVRPFKFATQDDKAVVETLLLEADHVIALDAHLDLWTQLQPPPQPGSFHEGMKSR